MNTKFVAATVLAIASLSSASVFAQSHQYGEAALVIAPVASTSNVTRAQVQAAYLQARQSGAVARSEEAAFSFAPAATPLMSRAEVRAQAYTSAKAMQSNGNSVL